MVSSKMDNAGEQIMYSAEVAHSGGVGHDITIIASRVHTVHFAIEFSFS